MKKFTCAVLFLAAVLVPSCSKKAESTTPLRRNITEAVYASGTVVPLNEYTVTSHVTGRIVRQLVFEGDPVQPGQTLVLLDNDVQSANAAAARASYELAQKNASENSPILREMLEAIEAAKARLELDEQNFLRHKSLLGQQAVTRAAYDQAEAQYLISKNAYEQAQARHRTQKIQLQASLEAARAQYLALAGTAEDFALKSAIDGRVYTVYKKLGELVTTQTPVMTIGNATTFKAEVFVDEADIARISEGQRVALKLENYEDRVFMGAVKKIYPQLTPANRSFKVDVMFDEAPPKLYAGVSVEANIIVAQRTNALVLPKEFVFGGDSVIVESDGEEIPKKITVGVQDLEYVEVTNGLKEHSVVLKAK